MTDELILWMRPCVYGELKEDLKNGDDGNPRYLHMSRASAECCSSCSGGPNDCPYPERGLPAVKVVVQEQEASSGEISQEAEDC